MKKQKIKSEFEVAVDDFFDAAREVRRAQQMFDMANSDFFEIANSELTIAKLHMEVCEKKLRLLEA